MRKRGPPESAADALREHLRPRLVAAPPSPPLPLPSLALTTTDTLKKEEEEEVAKKEQVCVDDRDGGGGGGASARTKNTRAMSAGAASVMTAFARPQLSDAFTLHMRGRLGTGRRDAVKPQTLAAFHTIVELNDLYNTDMWLALLEWSKTGTLDDFRAVYRAFLNVFPTASAHWQEWIQLEHRLQHLDKAEELLASCLQLIPDIALWRLQVSHVQLVHRWKEDSRCICVARSLSPSSSSSSCCEVCKTSVLLGDVYEWVLTRLGDDYDSGPVWQEYIAFLQKQPQVLFASESVRIDKIRKVYARALVSASNRVEDLWRAYDKWEHALAFSSKEIAAKFLHAVHDKYAVTREMARKRGTLKRTIRRNMLARPCSSTAVVCARPASSSSSSSSSSSTPSAKARMILAAEYRQVAAWRDLISYETSNPQHLTDPSALHQRITLTYRQALLSLRHYPEVWFEYAMHRTPGYFMHAVDVHKRTAGIFLEACAAMPGNILIRFLLAEYYEEIGFILHAKRVYDNMMIATAALDLVNRLTSATTGDESRRATTKMTKTNRRSRCKRPAAAGAAAAGDDDDDNEEGDEEEDDKDLLKKRAREEVAAPPVACARLDPIVVLQYLKFVIRRGSIRMAQIVLQKAIELKMDHWRMWVLVADMAHYRVGDTQLAIQLYDTAQTFYLLKSPKFALRYVDFMFELRQWQSAHATLLKLIRLDACPARLQDGAASTFADALASRCTWWVTMWATSLQLVRTLFDRCDKDKEDDDDDDNDNDNDNDDKKIGATVRSSGSCAEAAGGSSGALHPIMSLVRRCKDEDFVVVPPCQEACMSMLFAAPTAAKKKQGQAPLMTKAPRRSFVRPDLDGMLLYMPGMGHPAPLPLLCAGSTTVPVCIQAIRFMLPAPAMRPYACAVDVDWLMRSIATVDDADLKRIENDPSFLVRTTVVHDASSCLSSSLSLSLSGASNSHDKTVSSAPPDSLYRRRRLQKRAVL